MRFEAYSGSSLCALRFEKGWTQKQLSEQSGVTQESIALYEQDKTNPTINKLGKIGKALGVYLYASWPDTETTSNRIQKEKTMGNSNASGNYRANKIQQALYQEYKSGDALTTKQIEETVLQYTDIPKGSILPSDFCDNHKNQDPFSGQYPVFHKLSRGKYRLL